MQFPGRKRMARRTALTESADGRRVKLADPGAARTEWELEYRGLTGAELAAIESLFVATEGRLGAFGFLDPFDNLARWSEDLSWVGWMKDAGVTVAAGRPDPKGGMAATQVAGTGQVVQTLGVPAWFQYCVSLWVRGGAVTLVCGTTERAFDASEEWRRVELPAKLAGTAEAVEFGFAVDGTADVFGFQVEAQAGASGYKRTTSRGGVFLSASFLEDVLAVTTDGVNNHGCRVRVGAR